MTVATMPEITRDLSIAAEPLSEKLANIAQAIYAVTGPNASDGDSNRAHVQAIKLHVLLEEAQKLEAAYNVACGLLKEAERARLGLVEELSAAYDELATHRQVEKLIRVFIRDVDRCSLIVGDYVKPLIEQHTRVARGD